jgi:hypothetical protein
MNILSKFIKKDEVISFDKRTVKLSKKLGEGAYSLVFQGKDTKTNSLFAVKRMHAETKEQAADIEKEIKFMVFYFIYFFFITF